MHCMNSYNPLFYAEEITYPCPNVDAGLGNLYLQNRSMLDFVVGR